MFRFEGKILVKNLHVSEHFPNYKKRTGEITFYEPFMTVLILKNKEKNVLRNVFTKSGTIQLLKGIKT